MEQIKTKPVRKERRLKGSESSGLAYSEKKNIKF
jgi:hypothetical protein